MRPTVMSPVAWPLLVSLAFMTMFEAAAAGSIQYLSCRADNETEASTFGIDEATKKVCDRAVGAKWFAPAEFNAGVIEWSDSSTTKIIYRSGKHKHYERNILLLNHIGHCSKIGAPGMPPCAG